MTDLILYTNPMSRGRIARWMLEEVGAAYDVQVIPYGAPMKSSDYLAVNPMGKVPTLRHGDTVITECAAICAYLADAFPQAGLAPPPEDRAAYYRWFFFAAGPVEYAVANRAAGFEASADKQRILGYGSYETVLDTLDTLLSHTTFATGEHFRAVDVYLGAQIGWGLQFGTIEKRPAFEAYAGRVMDRDAARRAAALDNALAQQLSASA